MAGGAGEREEGSIMSDHEAGQRSRRFVRWFHETFGDWFFRSMIGPSQTDNAIQGGGRQAREQWKRDLERRKRFSQEERKRKRLARQARRSP